MSYHWYMSENENNPNAQVALGTLVNYHGSLPAQHGLYVVTAHHNPFHSPEAYADGVAYVLTPADETGKIIPEKLDDYGYTSLQNARVTSFTPVDPKVANPDRTKVE